MSSRWRYVRTLITATKETTDPYLQQVSLLRCLCLEFVYYSFLLCRSLLAYKGDNSRLPFPLCSPELLHLIQTPNNDYRWRSYTLCMNISLFQSKSSTYPLEEPLCSVSATPAFCFTFVLLCACCQ